MKSKRAVLVMEDGRVIPLKDADVWKLLRKKRAQRRRKYRIRRLKKEVVFVFFRFKTRFANVNSLLALAITVYGIWLYRTSNDGELLFTAVLSIIFGIIMLACGKRLNKG